MAASDKPDDARSDGDDGQLDEFVADVADNAPLAADTAGPAATGTTNYRTTAIIIACGLFMQNLDSTVLATALPTLSREFEVPPTHISLALTSYLLALAIFIPASGTIADRFGPRQVFQAAIAIFVAGSIACGFSTGLTSLVVARFVQGIGGAMMVPVGRLVLLRTVEKRDLISAVSWLAMPATIGPILGPPFGGLLVTYLDWRWIFWINVPMGMLGLYMVGRFIPNIRPSDPPRFDRLGFLLSAIALAPLIFGIEIAAQPGEGRMALPLIAIGAIGLIAYFLHARRTPRPILDLGLLQVPTFRLSIVGGTLARVAQGAQPFLLPMLMQLGFGLSAAASGGVTVMIAIGSFAMKGVVRRMLRWLGFRTALVTISILSPALFAVIGLFRPGWPWSVMMAILFVYGFLTSLQFSALNTIVYDEIEQTRMSAATSLYSTVQQLAMSIGVCAGSTFLSLAMALNDHDGPQFEDFSIAIWAVAAVSLTAVIANLRLDRNAGAEMSGRA